MWNGLGTLLLLSIALGGSSMLAGMVPLVFSLSRRHVRLMAACGAGILMGTALIVIIPEGVEALYNVGASHSDPAHQLRTRGSVTMPEVWTLKRSIPLDHMAQLDTILVSRADTEVPPKRPVLTGPDDGRPGKEDGKTTPDDESDEVTTPVTAPTEHEHEFEPHAWVGISLIAGFVLMYMIDTLPKLALAQNRLRPAYISLRRMGLRNGSANEEDGEDMHAEHASSPDGFGPSSTTTGLVIHAAADGIALGASSASSSQRLSMVIFFALMIHKAPAAFGLTTILLKQGLSKRAAKAHLLVFSLAAPVGALLTWGIASAIGSNAVDSGSQTNFITSLLLLFSGGTFLYVAMHTMQQGGHEHGAPSNGNGNAYSDIYQQQAAKEADEPTMVDTLATVGGMLIPLLTQVNHSH